MTKLAKPSSDTDRATNPRMPKLQVFGGFELHDPAGTVIPLTTRKGRQLLAYLAVPGGISHSREHLATLLWADRQDEQARGSLRTALSGIRRALGDDALIVENDAVRLTPGAVVSDYDALKAISENQQPVDALEDICPGPLLDGFEHDDDAFGDWLRATRNDVLQLAQQVIETSAAHHQKTDNPAAAIRLMRDSLSLEPLREATHRAIMLLYAQTGERAMALAQFRACKQLLMHELGAEPDPETAALADRIALRENTNADEMKQQLSTAMAGVAAAAPAASAPTVRDGSIAVLPFANTSGDAEQADIIDGITEDILTDLASIQELSVTANSASQIYSGTGQSAQQIASELGVRYVLEGSMRKAGDTVRISARLIEAQANLQVWAQRYDRQVDDIFELQTEISRAIVTALRANLATLTTVPKTNHHSHNAEAYQYFLRGRSLSRQFALGALQAARLMFDQAIKLDPEYAAAYAGLAMVDATIAFHYPQDEGEANTVLENCETSLKINPGLADAYAARGQYYITLADPDECIKNASRAVELNPSSAEAHSILGFAYLQPGDYEAAFRHLKNAYALDQGVWISMMLLTSLNGVDRPDEQRHYAGQVLEDMRKRVEINPHDAGATFMIASAYADLGDADQARHWIAISTAFATDDARLTYNIACAQSRLGLIDEALNMLAQTIELGISDSKRVYLLSADPDLKLVRQDPRFAELIAATIS